MARPRVDGRLPISQDEARALVRLGAPDLALGQDDERMPQFMQGLGRTIEERGVSLDLRRRLDFRHARRSVVVDDQEVRRVEAAFRQFEA